MNEEKYIYDTNYNYIKQMLHSFNTAYESGHLSNEEYNRNAFILDCERQSFFRSKFLTYLDFRDVIVLLPDVVKKQLILCYEFPYEFLINYELLHLIYTEEDCYLFEKYSPYEKQKLIRHKIANEQEYILSWDTNLLQRLLSEGYSDLFDEYYYGPTGVYADYYDEHHMFNMHIIKEYIIHNT